MGKTRHYKEKQPSRFIQARQMKGVTINKMSDLIKMELEDYILAESGLREFTDHQLERFCFVTGFVPRWFEKKPLAREEFPIKESTLFIK